MRTLLEFSALRLGKKKKPSCLHGGPSGVSSDLGPGAGDGEGAWRSSRRGPKFMLIRAEPASSLPCAAPAASSPGHSAGRSGRAAPGGGTRAPWGSPSGGGSRAGERRILRGRHRAGPSGDRARWVTVCPCGCAPSRRCSRRRRPRAHRSSHGQHSPVPPATASTRQDGVLGFARGRISKCGARSRPERVVGGRVARGAPPLPPARTRAEASRPGDPQPRKGRFPQRDLLRGRAPHVPGGCGVGEEQVSGGALARRLGSWQCPWKPFQRSNIFQLLCEQTPGTADQVEGEEAGLPSPGTRGAPPSLAFCLSFAPRGCG